MMIAALVLGCGSDAGPSTPTRAIDYCEAIEPFFCAFYVRCGRMDVATTAACKASFLASCNEVFEPRYVDLEAAGLLSLDADGIERCRQHLASVACDQQIQELDGDLGLVVESYNAAQIELDRIQAEQRANERRLKIARANLGDAQTNLEARLVELYVNGQTDLIEILLGSSSLDDILDGLETANRVSSQDSQILDEVRRFRKEVKKHEAELEQAAERQEQVVAERAAKRDQIEAALAERQRLLRGDPNAISAFAMVEHDFSRTLREIRVPTLVIHARNDPWIPAARYAAFDWSSNPRLVLLMARAGGHLGFHDRNPRVAWHDRCIAAFFARLVGPER